MKPFLLRKKVLASQIMMIIFSDEYTKFELEDGESVLVDREFLAVNQTNIGDFYLTEDTISYTVPLEIFQEDYRPAKETKVKQLAK